MKPSMPTPASPDAVEQAFYEAMQQGRLDALMACWIDEEDPVCVHPGGPRLVGLSAIAESFGAMFEHGAIAVQAERVHQALFQGMAVHSVLETVTLATDDGVLATRILATNVYVLTAAGWKMAVHHASPAPAAAATQAPAGARTLH